MYLIHVCFSDLFFPSSLYSKSFSCSKSLSGLLMLLIPILLLFFLLWSFGPHLNIILVSLMMHVSPYLPFPASITKFPTPSLLLRLFCPHLNLHISSIPLLSPISSTELLLAFFFNFPVSVLFSICPSVHSSSVFFCTSSLV